MFNFRIFLACSLVCLLLALTAGRAYAGEHFPFVGEVKKGPVNVRAGANANFEIITKLKVSDEVIVLGQSYEWYKVQLPATVNAFIRADYIKELPGHFGEIIGTRVNVRAKADSTSSILGQLSKGDYVQLVEKINDWWIIKPPAHAAAWVHADFVTLKSKQVPPDTIRKVLTADDLPKVKSAPPPPVVEEGVAVGIQGTLQMLSEPAANNAHYQIMVDGKPAYFIQDAPGLDRFVHAVVHVNGVITPENKSLVHLKTISLVL